MLRLFELVKKWLEEEQKEESNEFVEQKESVV